MSGFAPTATCIVYKYLTSIRPLRRNGLCLCHPKRLGHFFGLSDPNSTSSSVAGEKENENSNTAH